MKFLFIALILAVTGDVAFNHAHYTDRVLGNVSALARGSADAVSGSIFAS